MPRRSAERARRSATSTWPSLAVQLQSWRRSNGLQTRSEREEGARITLAAPVRMCSGARPISNGWIHECGKPGADSGGRKSRTVSQEGYGPIRPISLDRPTGVSRRSQRGPQALWTRRSTWAGLRAITLPGDPPPVCRATWAAHYLRTVCNNDRLTGEDTHDDTCIQGARCFHPVFGWPIPVPGVPDPEPRAIHGRRRRQDPFFRRSSPRWRGEAHRRTAGPFLLDRTEEWVSLDLWVLRR